MDGTAGSAAEETANLPAFGGLADELALRIHGGSGEKLCLYQTWAKQEESENIKRQQRKN